MFIPCVKTMLASGLLALPAFSQLTTLINDFESGTEQNVIDGGWYYFDDSGNEGNSKITSGDTTFTPPMFNGDACIAPGYGDSKFAGSLSFTFGTKTPTCGPTCTFDPEVGWGTDIKDGDTVIDLTGATALTFYAKADKPMKVAFLFGTAEITDFAKYRQTLNLTTEWAPFTVELKISAAFRQPSWGIQKVPINLKLTQSIDWLVSKTDNPGVTGGTFYLDDLKILGWEPKVEVSLAPRAAGASRFSAVHGPQGNISVTLGEPYRRTAGTILSIGPTGRVTGKARYGREQGSVVLQGGQGGVPTFIRVLPDPAR